jgi:hypothetical protein
MVPWIKPWLAETIVNDRDPVIQRALVFPQGERYVKCVITF